MTLTEDMISGIVKDITGDYKIQYHPQGPEGEAVTIDFTPPWKRYSMIEELENRAGFKIPMPLESQECYDFLVAKCKELNIEFILSNCFLSAVIPAIILVIYLAPSPYCDENIKTGR